MRTLCPGKEVSPFTEVRDKRSLWKYYWLEDDAWETSKRSGSYKLRNSLLWDVLDSETLHEFRKQVKENT